MIPGLGKNANAAQKGSVEVDHGLVLIVDESAPIRQKLVEILTKLGTRGDAILQATTEDEAIAAFRAHHPRVVFAELIGVHPEDGLEILHEILEIDASTRIVLVTAEAREGPEVRAALRAGVFAVVDKPLRYEKIRAVLADIEAEEGGIERFR